LKRRNEAIQLCEAHSRYGHRYAKAGDQFPVRGNDGDRAADDALHVFLIGFGPSATAGFLEKLQEGFEIHDGVVGVPRQSERAA
jgi:hypothetical protein